MKARITHLKAPWPLGARVGDVVEFADIPAWAAGKCEQVDDEQPVTLEFGEPVQVDLVASGASEVEALKAAVADLTEKLEAAELAVLQHAEAAQVAQAAVQSADATISGLNGQVADLTEKLEAAQAKTGKK